MHVDAKTLAAASNSVGFCLTLLAVILWLGGKMYAGFGRWTLARILISFTTLLSIQVGVWPASITVLAADALGIFNLALTLEACQEFLGMRFRVQRDWIAGICVFLLLVYFYLSLDSVRANYFVMVLLAGIIYFFCAWTIIWRAPPGFQNTGCWTTGISFTVMAAAYGARAFYYLSRPGGDLVDSDPWNLIFLEVLILSTITTNFGFFLMHYERLLSDREEVATQTERANSDLTHLKERLEETVKSRTAELVEALDEASAAEARLRDLTGHLLRLQNEERRRIARDLHDSTGQNLAALRLNLALLQAARLPPEVAGVVPDSLALTDTMLTEIRTLAHLLHPPLLDELGLASAIRTYLEGFSARSGIDVQCSMPESGLRLGRDVELALFRIMQESLTNVHRHSDSERCWVILRKEAGAVTLEVRDEGRGSADLAGAAVRNGVPTPGVGLSGMQERARQLGGNLKVETGYDGWRVHVRLPVADEN
jgi:signal transduction histidine kinase